jgi:hypothetical protein
MAWPHRMSGGQKELSTLGAGGRGCAITASCGPDRKGLWEEPVNCTQQRSLRTWSRKFPDVVNKGQHLRENH